MLSIHLNNIFFFAYHGLYDNEKKDGNNFEVDITIKYLPKEHILNISQTINYVDVYDLLDARMQIATPLLETLVMEIAKQILVQFYLAEEVNISVKKMQPPIANFDGSVGVSYSIKRSDL